MYILILKTEAKLIIPTQRHDCLHFWFDTAISIKISDGVKLVTFVPSYTQSTVPVNHLHLFLNGCFSCIKSWFVRFQKLFSYELAVFIFVSLCWHSFQYPTNYIYLYCIYSIIHVYNINVLVCYIYLCYGWCRPRMAIV
jgi:hypothetical protein